MARLPGNRPRRRRPDDHRSVLRDRLDSALRRFDRAACERRPDEHAYGKRHIHRVADVVLVLDLGLGERGLLDHAPHHRLGAAVEQAVGGELEDLARDLRLGGIAHRRIGMIPVADDAEPLELLALHRQPVLGVGAAFAAEGDHRLGVAEVGLGLALAAVVLLLDLPFDRQAVAVPAGHVVGVLARHLLRADDQVLEDLVERVADVDVAVGVGRAVVQHEFRPAGGALRAAGRTAPRAPSGREFPALSAADRPASGNRSWADRACRNSRGLGRARRSWRTDQHAEITAKLQASRRTD